MIYFHYSVFVFCIQYQLIAQQFISNLPPFRFNCLVNNFRLINVVTISQLVISIMTGPVCCLNASFYFNYTFLIHFSGC
ncbi:hypothetical protein CW304_01410 [Bacillus sp. UFRGS-B20]|nr:hypothetical protein CW304_01410 [Bacillus sp. UFRGS-B20]